MVIPPEPINRFRSRSPVNHFALYSLGIRPVSASAWRQKRVRSWKIIWEQSQPHLLKHTGRSPQRVGPIRQVAASGNAFGLTGKFGTRLIYALLMNFDLPFHTA